MITFKIHQIKDIENTDYAFRSFNPNKFNFEDYECRYISEIEKEDKTYIELCDDIFYIFNMRIPENFEGHSLSVSDIIELQPYGVPTFYYCNMCGFTKLSRKDMEARI